MTSHQNHVNHRRQPIKILFVHFATSSQHTQQLTKMVKANWYNIAVPKGQHITVTMVAPKTKERTVKIILSNAVTYIGLASQFSGDDYFGRLINGKFKESKEGVITAKGLPYPEQFLNFMSYYTDHAVYMANMEECQSGVEDSAIVKQYLLAQYVNMENKQDLEDIRDSALHLCTQYIQTELFEEIIPIHIIHIVTECLKHYDPGHSARKRLLSNLFRWYLHKPESPLRFGTIEDIVELFTDDADFLIQDTEAIGWRMLSYTKEQKIPRTMQIVMIGYAKMTSITTPLPIKEAILPPNARDVFLEISDDDSQEEEEELEEDGGESIHWLSD